MAQTISFSSDYTRNAHPAILQRLLDMGMEQNVGYGTDEICRSAADKIKKACECPGAEVFFLVGGTQTNQTVIDMLLKPYEGVVAAQTGHVAAHEAGAIEFSGHKVLPISAKGEETDTAKYGSNIGKISAKELKTYLEGFFADDNHEHMVFPGAVYISHPTEYGTLYTKKELQDISEVCKEYNLPLFLDGARLGYGLMSKRTDVTLKDIAELTDVFYIGGTKVGAMFGEAVVFTKGGKPDHHIPIIKQHGALLAKGWLLGVQFDELFTDNLYFEIGKNAIDAADRIRAALTARGYNLTLHSPTNQIFITFEKEHANRLSEQIEMGFIENIDPEHAVMRIATSWATRKEDVDALISIL